MKKLILFLSFIVGQISYSQTFSKEIIDKIHNGEVGKAEDLLSKKLESDPNDIFSLNTLGDLYSFTKNWDKAISCYEKLVKLKPLNADYNFKYGGAVGMKALSVSKIQAVVYVSDIKTYLEKTINLDPKHIEARRALIELYMKLPGFLGGDQDRAKILSEQLESISRVDAYLAQAFILKENGNIQDAKEAYNKAFVLYNSLPESKRRNSLNYELGKIAAEMDIQSSFGLKLLNTYIKNYNYKDIYSLEWAFLRKAQIHVDQENKSEAFLEINKALSINNQFKEGMQEKRRIQNL